MSLPNGWKESRNYWHATVRAPGRFKRLRTKPLEGMNGVSIVGGPVVYGGPFVVQSVRFLKSAWPLTAAVGWFHSSKFSGQIENPKRTNPPKGSLPQIEQAYNEGYNNGRIDKAIGHRSDYVFTDEPGDSLEHSDSGVRWRTAYRMGYRDGWNGADRRRSFTETRKNPPRKGKPETWIESSSVEELAEDPGSPYRMVTAGGQRFGLSTLDAIRAQREGLPYLGRGTAPAAASSQLTPFVCRKCGEKLPAIPGYERSRWRHCSCGGVATRENPPKIRRGQLRLGSFKAAAHDALEEIARLDAELDGLMNQVYELTGRGEALPSRLMDRIRAIQIERGERLEQSRTAMHRLVAVHEELSPRETRRNPPNERAEAISLYEEFHGARPENVAFRRIPDLTKLVTLGEALEIHYRAHVPRGSKNTPYRHEFGSGTMLLTDATGKALVILGKLNVGRAPRGRLGYIRG